MINDVVGLLSGLLLFEPIGNQRALSHTAGTCNNQMGLVTLEEVIESFEIG